MIAWFLIVLLTAGIAWMLKLLYDSTQREREAKNRTQAYIDHIYQRRTKRLTRVPE